MRFLAALFLSKVFLAFIVVVAVFAAIRGRLRTQLRLLPDVASPVPTRWALSVASGARLHRRLQGAAAAVAAHAPPRGRGKRRKATPSATARAAADTLDAARRADQALADAAHRPKPERKAAFRRAAAEVEKVEQLAEQTLRRARLDASGHVLDATATAVRIDP